MSTHKEYSKELIELWRARAKTADKLLKLLAATASSALVGYTTTLKQCAKELENPPVELFEKLGIPAPDQSQATPGRKSP